MASDRSDLVDQALPEPAPRPRMGWIDVARGLTIILVVLFHTVRGVMGSGLVSNQSPLRAIDFAVYTFHMPAFFFFSGLFMRQALARPPWVFWPGRVRALLLPYALWMSVEIGFLALTASVSNMGEYNPSIGTFLWSPLAPFWFLYALFCINAILYCARRLPNRGLLALALSLYALSWVLASTLQITLPLQTASGLLFTSLGMLFAPWISRQWPRSFAITLLLFFGVGLSSYPFFLWGFRPEMVPVSAILGIAGIVLLSKFLDSSPISNLLWPLRLLGQISLTILVIHILGTAGARVVLVRLLHLHQLWLHLPIDTMVGLALSVVVQWAAFQAGVTGWLGLPNVPVRSALPSLPRPPSMLRDSGGAA